MNKILLNKSALNLTGPAVTRLCDWVKKAVSTYPLSQPYGITATDLMYAYEFGNLSAEDKAKIAKVAVLMVDKYITIAEAEIAAGRAPAISGDQYLNVGPQVRDVCLVMDWGHEFVTEPQHDRWNHFVIQAAYNIEFPKTASWGGKTFAWPGWAKDDPANNYFFSHLLALICEILINDSNPVYVNTRAALLESFWSKYEGGGSPEGTGYGVALARLFEVCLIWRDSTGQDIAAVTKLAEQTISYIVHATVPKFDEIAPLGDQARISRHMIDDPDRFLMLWARALAKDEDAKNLATWWLGEIPLARMKALNNAKFDLLDHGTLKKSPTELVYHAIGAGHLFARNAWTRDASYIVVAAGPNNQSHDQDDQGAVSFYSNGVWLAVTQNIWTRSGIEGTPEYQNTLRFIDAAGKTIRQDTKGVCYIDDMPDENGYARFVLNLDDAHATPIDWIRYVYFKKGACLIRDYYGAAVGITAAFQLNTPILPVVDGKKIVAGNLTVDVLLPNNPIIKITDYKALNATNNPGGGYKIEISGGNGEYLVELLDNTIIQEEEPVPSPEIEELRAKVLQLQGIIDEQAIEEAESQRIIAAYKLAEAQSQEVIAGLHQQVTDANAALGQLYDRVDAAESKLDATNDNIRAFRDAQQKLFAGVE